MDVRETIDNRLKHCVDEIVTLIRVEGCFLERLCVKGQLYSKLFAAL